MYRISLISSQSDFAQLLVEALRSQNLQVELSSILSKRFPRAEAYLIHVDDLSLIDLLPPKIFEFPCVLMFDGKTMVDSVCRNKFDRVFRFPFVFSNICMYLKFLIYSHKSILPESKLIFSDLVVNLDTREVRSGKNLLVLSHKEFCLLEFFMRHIGKPCTRNQILEGVWDRNFNIFTNTVDVHISRLRRKLDSSNPERFIKTIHGFGYVLRKNS